MEKSSGNLRRTLGGCLVILLAVLLCSVASVFAVDQMCYTSMSKRLPAYPNAELIAERHNLFRARGMGETYLEYRSSDDPDTVQRWYGENVGAVQREALRTGDQAYFMASADRSITAATDGSGSQIQLYGRCAN